jgi:hypothetical protein
MVKAEHFAVMVLKVVPRMITINNQQSNVLRSSGCMLAMLAELFPEIVKMKRRCVNVFI